MAGRNRKADAGLVLALACGASAESAAQKAQVSLRTVYRRLAEPGFRAQVDAMRTEMAQRGRGC
jgi:ABC-type sugar transport system substrate-binding protein